MNEPEQHPVQAAPARVRAVSRFTFAVWLVPLIALFTGAWLLMDNIRNSGPEITLYMDSAEGIEVNNTVIRVLNVEVGRVNKIRLREDRSGVELTARLNADAGDMMREDTQFWIVKPRIDQNGVSGLNTLVSGAYIAFTPGKSEQERDHFDVADLPPISAIGQHGIRLKLSGENHRMLEVGSPVMYEGFNVGLIESAQFNPADRRVNYTVFIQSPNDQLIRQNSQFWLQSGISVETGGSGIRVDSPPLPALLSGAITFRTPDNQARAAANNDTFEIYNDRAAIDNLPGERALYYTAFFRQSVRGLMPGAPVEYKGLRIGSVAAVPYFAEGDSLKLFDQGWIPVRLRIEPHLLEQGAAAQSQAYWQDNLRRALDRGLSATLSSNNLILGSKMIELDDRPSESPRLMPFADYRGDPVIATRGGGLDDLQSALTAFADKLNRLPLEQTVNGLNGSLAELKATLAGANKLLKQPGIQNLPAELNRTLAALRTTLAGVSPESPAYREAQAALKSVDQTLRDARPLLDTLNEQPNALIFRQSHTDPVPKGRP